MLIRLCACEAMGGARLAELALSRRNMAESGEAAEGEWSRATYPLVVALHAAVIGGTFLFGRGRPRWGWIVLLIGAQPVRIWVLATLGRRWNTRAAVPAEMEIASGGPYAFVRHPNYTVVAVELLALPLAFGLRWLAVAGAVANAILLGPRIGEEEEALMRHPAYRSTMARRKRFIPGVF